MPIRRKSTFNKKYYESIGQGSFFGYDNIHFKTVNLPKKQRLINLCKKFSVKLIIRNNSILLNIIKLS